ncbi:MAG: polysaccharide biosynthesis tyrosine autokinase [Actinomycetota bacterium]
MQSTRDDFEDGDGFSLKPRELLEVLWRRRGLMLVVTVVVTAVGVFAARGGAPIYRAESRVHSAASDYQFNIINSTDPFAGIMTAAAGEALPAQFQTLQSPEFQAEAIKTAGVNSAPGTEPPSISVSANPADGIIVIGAVGGNPEEVSRVANAMAELHLQRTTEQNEIGLRRAITFLQDGRASAEKRLSQAQVRLANFNGRFRLAELSQEREAYARRREMLEARVADLTAAVASSEAELSDLQLLLSQTPTEEETQQTQANPLVDRLQQQLDDLRFKREALLIERPATSRDVKLIDAQIDELRERLSAQPATRTVAVRQVNPERKVVTARVADVKRTANKQRRERAVIQAQLQMAEQAASRAASTVRGREYEQQRLTGERDAAKAALDQFSTRLADLELRKIARVETARVIARAVPPKWALPTNRSAHLVTALIAALIAGVVAAFIRETFDDRLTKVDDVQKLTDRPVLVHVPQILDVSSPLLSLLPSHSPAGEAYRSLRFSLRLAMAQKPFKKLLVTSPSEGEGKTVTAVNLSIALALEGWKVILVDGDLRRPSVHRLLELRNDTGLSEVLGGLIPLEIALRSTGVANLRVLSSGPTPHNPSELLGGPAFEQLADELTEMADVVVFDSPPCLPVTDPLLIGEQAGAVILVVQSGQTRKEAIRQALGHLSRVNATLLGLVVNKVTRGQGYYGYHTYYGYSSVPGNSDRGEGGGSTGGSTGGGVSSSPFAGSGPGVSDSARGRQRWPRFVRNPDKTHRR